MSGSMQRRRWWAWSPLVVGLAVGLGSGCSEDTATPDTIAPAWVNDLEAMSPTRTTVTLTWSAPGDDWNDGRAAVYDVRFAQTEDSLKTRWSLSRSFPVGRVPRNAGAAETVMVAGLEAGTKYYFGIKTGDETPNWSEISNLPSRTTIAPPDTTAPGGINDLHLAAATTAGVTVGWTAPGDDGSSGRVTSYDLRYSTVSDSAANWWEEWTEIATDLPLPGEAGTWESYTLNGLDSATTYYLALRSTDESGNTSILSNVLEAATQREDAAILRVLADGSGDYATIQAALDAAFSGDLVELESGGIFRGDGNRDLSFAGKAVTLRTEGGAREIAVLDCEGSVADPHRAIRFETFEGVGTVIDFVAFKNGYAPAGNLPDERYGGAILCASGTHPTFRNCAFSDHQALYGGAIFAEEAAPLLQACTFERNLATAGGGALYSSGDFSGGTGVLRLIDCQFIANQAETSGGAVMFANGGRPEIDGCLFQDNAGALGGAVKCQNQAAPTFDDCLFASNQATNSAYPNGGALHLHGYVAAAFYNCAFRENSADEAAGAVYCTDHSPTSFSDCVFLLNVAATGAALSCWSSSEPTLTGCTFYANTSGAASATILCETQSAPTIERSVIAFTSGGAALIMDQTSDAAELICCDLFGNDGGDWIGALADDLAQNGNILSDPLFCDPAAGNLYLQPESPCAETQSGCGRMGAFGIGCE